MLVAFDKRHFDRAVGVKVPKNPAVTRLGSWGSGRNPDPHAIMRLVRALRIHGEIRQRGHYATYPPYASNQRHFFVFIVGHEALVSCTDYGIVLNGFSPVSTDNLEMAEDVTSQTAHQKPCFL